MPLSIRKSQKEMARTETVYIWPNVDKAKMCLQVYSLPE